MRDDLVKLVMMGAAVVVGVVIARRAAALQVDASAYVPGGGAHLDLTMTGSGDRALNANYWYRSRPINADNIENSRPDAGIWVNGINGPVYLSMFG